MISGADDNAIDFVAVQYARMIGNVIEHANDWCAYVKGGSAFVLVARNRIRECETGGFTAGRERASQFMTAHFTRYEAYGIDVLDNVITNTERRRHRRQRRVQRRASPRNRLWNVGTRSHWLEVGYGSRSCDGGPGDEGRERCGWDDSGGPRP